MLKVRVFPNYKNMIRIIWVCIVLTANTCSLQEKKKKKDRKKERKKERNKQTNKEKKRNIQTNQLYYDYHIFANQ